MRHGVRVCVLYAETVSLACAPHQTSTPTNQRRPFRPNRNKEAFSFTRARATSCFRFVSPTALYSFQRERLVCCVEDKEWFDQNGSSIMLAGGTRQPSPPAGRRRPINIAFV